ncbi:facilitated trehalose transporter Tret1 [Teleopsis dalmanni]|uniref:facilitated trehalose transporter Tret1 n=1 Tax=Teleopsis dalmanni TaxID=139649 RepID=UPI0018CD3824|nr:facilitated trehalose transporter Tret1 [Teleopsis dalmanni]
MCIPKVVEGVFIQRLATVFGSLLCLNFGVTFGITPTHTQLYRSIETPLNRPISYSQGAWITGHLFLTAACGALISGFAARKIGAKAVLLIAGLLQITGWFCIHFGYDILHIYSSRMFAGVAAGASFTVLPIYINEISEPVNRGQLMVTMDVLRAVGIILGFLFGMYIPYDFVNIVGLGISFAFALAFPFMQESPYYYQRNNNVSNMEKSLRWFRGIRDFDMREKPEYLQELAIFKGVIQNKRIAEMTMPRAYVLKLFLYAIVLAIGTNLNGALLFLTYAPDILEKTEIPLDHNILILILAAMQIVGALLTYLIGEKINRKILLCITAFLSGCCLVSVAVFLIYGDNWQINPIYAPWLPFGLLAAFMVFTNMGLYPVTTTMTIELLPERLNSKILSISSSISWFLLFGAIEAFYPITKLFGFTTWIWFFVGISSLLVLFSLFILPETRGRTAEEIQQQMGYVNSGNVARITTITHGHVSHGYI